MLSILVSLVTEILFLYTWASLPGVNLRIDEGTFFMHIIVIPLALPFLILINISISSFLYKLFNKTLSKRQKAYAVLIPLSGPLIWILAFFLP